VSGTGLLTVTVLAVEVVLLPAASLATAVKTCWPFVVWVVFHEIEYGDVVSSVPRLLPSILNCTPMTPTLSDALAETVREVPETVAPLDGAVRETVGLSYRAEAGGYQHWRSIPDQ